MTMKKATQSIISPHHSFRCYKKEEETTRIGKRKSERENEEKQ